MMNERGRVLAVCISDRRGIRKSPVSKGVLVKDFGLQGDAHAGTPKRQVSLLCDSSIEKMRAEAPELAPGDFAENLTVACKEWSGLPIGARLYFERGPLLEITQIGKECHAGCAIRELVGDCVMPREGLFARVVEGGEVRPGDAFKVVRNDEA